LFQRQAQGVAGDFGLLGAVVALSDKDVKLVGPAIGLLFKREAWKCDAKLDGGAARCGFRGRYDFGCERDPGCVLGAPDGLLEGLLGARVLFGVKVAGAVAQNDILARWNLDLQSVKFSVRLRVRTEGKLVKSGGVLADAVESTLEIAASIDGAPACGLGKLTQRPLNSAYILLDLAGVFQRIDVAWTCWPVLDGGLLLVGIDNGGIESAGSCIGAGGVHDVEADVSFIECFQSMLQRCLKLILTLCSDPR